jgi:hypothetical protein
MLVYENDTVLNSIRHLYTFPLPRVYIEEVRIEVLYDKQNRTWGSRIPLPSRSSSLTLISTSIPYYHASHIISVN